MSIAEASASQSSSREFEAAMWLADAHINASFTNLETPDFETVPSVLTSANYQFMDIGLSDREIVCLTQTNAEAVPYPNEARMQTVQDIAKLIRELESQ